MLIEVIDAFILMYKIFNITSIVAIIFLYERKDLRDIYMITIFLFNIFEVFTNIFFRGYKICKKPFGISEEKYLKKIKSIHVTFVTLTANLSSS